MGFNKQTSQPAVGIIVKHSWHPGAAFVFYFPKRLPETALNAEQTYLGLQDSERPDEYRLALINVVAEMASSEPEEFDDFPGAAEIAGIKKARTQLKAEGLKDKEREEIEGRVEELERSLAVVRQVPLAKRMRDYFDDPTQPELEMILAGAWRAYKAAVIPAAYIKSPEDSGASGDLSLQAAG
ncbi:MAG: hypothetical protein ABW208_07140 [Pyrinomonadaceae bacterium]